MAEPQEVAFAVGGRDNDGRLLPSVERYDAASGVWPEAAPMAVARGEFGLCELEGELYVTGGKNVEGGSLASVERYDPNLDTWSVAPAMPLPRRGHCACAVGDAMYVLGGVEETVGQSERSVGSVLRFDSKTQTWSEVAPMPAEPYFAGACVLGGAIYIVGGGNGINEATPTTYCLHTETDHWTTLAPMLKAKFFHSVCMLDGLIYVIGGDSDDEFAVCSVYRFDPVANSWSTLAPMNVARSELEAFVLGENIHAVGGSDGQSRLTSMERYCVASDSWSEISGGDLGEGRKIRRPRVVC
jgi:N-acetylneuraminic acid mutarotase